MSPPGKWSSSELSQLVEKQMRNWELARAQCPAEPPTEADRPVAAYVAISRAVGLPAFKVATFLHERLGWPIFDRDILQVMSGDDVYRRRLYAHMDGRDLGWLEGFVRGLTQSRYTRDDYFRRLSETVLSIARQGHAIFIGRGVSHILPRDTGLAVRLTAPREFCIESYARQKDLSIDAAVGEVAEIEDDRSRYIKNHFHIDWEEPTQYDLVINMEQFPVEATGELILTAACQRALIPPASPAL